MKKRVLTLIGAAIAIAGIVFVGHRLFVHADEIRSLRLGWTGLATLGAASLFSAGLCLFLGLSWRSVLAHLGGALTLPQSLRIYGVSNIGKYIPGNVFQYAGRQVLAQQAGLPAGLALKSMLWELVLFAAVSLLFALLALPGYLHWPPWAGVGLFLIGFAAAAAAARIALGPHILAAALYQFAYLLGMGVVFVMALGVLTDLPAAAIPVFIGAYVVSWLIGLLTPGAPAGIGVRELALYAMLTATLDQSVIAPAVLMGRAVNVAGDVLFFLAVLPIRKVRASQPSG